ncbi:MAG: type II secretion system protein GspG [Kiritimatiellae bacterium]|nr:type II secretion system protein GspG [Kiritimatiellia bacterium]
MKKENKFANAVKRGFTLVELLVVVAILGILATGAVVYVPRFLESGNKGAAEKDVQALKTAVTQYYTDKRKYPDNLDVLVDTSGDKEPYIEGGEGALIDPWGNKYEIKFKGNKKNSPYIVSGGPDGTIGTEDDIRSDETKK